MLNVKNIGIGIVVIVLIAVAYVVGIDTGKNPSYGFPVYHLRTGPAVDGEIYTVQSPDADTLIVVTPGAFFMRIFYHIGKESGAVPDSTKEYIYPSVPGLTKEQTRLEVFELLRGR